MMPEQRYSWKLEREGGWEGGREGEKEDGRVGGVNVTCRGRLVGPTQGSKGGKGVVTGITSCDGVLMLFELQGVAMGFHGFVMQLLCNDFY